MRKLLIFLVFLYSATLYGQDDAGAIVGTIDGTINVSMLGGATYYIPLDIPQGVNGMQPGLGIAYNSQGGNGILGYGWNVSGISTITRTGSTLYHDGKMTAADFSSDDNFMLDGQRLILVGISGNNYEYKTENDEFSKIVLKKENGYFSKCEVRLENGNIIKYGYTANSKLMANDGNNVIKWMANSIADRNGNTISYVYETVGTNSDLYIKEISYTSNSQVGLTSQFLVSFTYSNNRFDDSHYYIAGNKVVTDRLLTGIDVAKGNETLVSYSFSYDGDTDRMYNLLTEILLSKGDSELYPTVIQWNTDENDISNNSLYSQETDRSILNKMSFVGDFNGDGYSDLLTVPYKPYNGNVTASVYYNDMEGGFSSTPNYTIPVPDTLDWIHVLDLNGDGYDDIVLQTLVVTNNGSNNVTGNTGFMVYESLQGNGFSNVYNVCMANRLLIRPGDFIGERRNSLLLIKISADDINNWYTIEGYPALLHYDNGYTLSTFGEELFEEGAVVTDDFDGDGKTEIIVFDSDNRIRHSFYKQNGQYHIATTTDEFSNYLYASYFTGDFNNDGKADIIYNDVSNYKYIMLSTGPGFTNPIEFGSGALNNIVFPAMQQYKYSLANVNTNFSYGVNFTDLDGDGKTDILYYNSNNNPKFFRDIKFACNNSNPVATFKIDYTADNEEIKFENQYFTMGNFLGEDHVSFIAVDPQSTVVTTDDEVKIYSLPSTAGRFSVSSITDGMGKRTDIEYGYLMPGQTDLYHFANRPYTNEVKPCPMPLLAMKSYTECVGTNHYKTQFRYGNALIHRTGRGFVNFEEVERTSYVNNVPVKLEKSKYELSTMGVNAMALPQCDTTFVYNGTDMILSETNSYTFQNVRCSKPQSAVVKLIARPAVMSKKTKRFNPDAPGQLLSVELTEYTYNNISSGTYANTYACTQIQTGMNGTDCNGVSNCGYRNTTQILYKSNNTTNWIINRKSRETSVTQYASKPSITRRTDYEYATTGSPYNISTKTVIPSANVSDPLTVRYSYLYDVCGNVLSETVSAPYGTHYEAPVVTSYTYGNYRLVATKTTDPGGLAYQDQYTYDNYDRVTSHVGSNGLTTTYAYYNNFGTNTTTYAPDGVSTIDKLLWATSGSYVPSDAVYYRYMKTSGRPLTKIYYDINGNAIRTAVAHIDGGVMLEDISYNDRNQPTQQSNPYLNGETPQWTTLQYDGFGRLTRTTAPDGTMVSNSYNGFTTTTTTTSGNTSRTSVQTTNYLGWVANNTDASNAVVSYDYYSDGKPASMTTSSGSVSVEMEYDDAGNRTLLDDPDYGETTSVYDAYGRLVRQNTPKNDRYDYSYDVLGRVTQKTVQGDATTTSYQYNENTHKGTLASVTHNGQTLSYAYDNYDRLTTVSETRTDTTYVTSYTYNAYSQISTRTYPSGYKVFYGYYANGMKKTIKDEGGNTLWQANDINASGQLVRATTGNGAVTTNLYDAATRRLTGSVTSGGIQNFAYSFDGFGNLTSRTDSIGTVKTETFTYDNLDRLTGITFNNVGSAMVYDSYGRMTSKQREGASVFSSALFSSTKPHATRRFSTPRYDFPDGQSVEYNSLDKVSRISHNSTVAQFTYGYDGQRMRMTSADTVTNRTRSKDYVGDCEFVNDNGVNKVYTYLMGPYGVFAVVVTTGGTDAVHYVYKDHLGSWTAITDASGNVEERRSFDAWGNLRNPSTWDCSVKIRTSFDRGFTGHEHLFDFGLINMNGRMYDPVMSSFLSPDNCMQDPTSQQGFNRYAYCMYNPLKYVDPTGEQYTGWDPSLINRMEQEARHQVLKAWEHLCEVAMVSHILTMKMASCLFSDGLYTPAGGSGNHGSGGGGNERKVLCEAHQTFDDKQRDNINSSRSQCVYGSLGSTCSIWDGALDTQQWIDSANEYGINVCDTENLEGLIISKGYFYKEISIDQICNAMNQGYVVNVWCSLTNDIVNYYNLNGSSHNINISDCIMYDNGDISITFSDFKSPGFMVPYESNINPPNRVFNFKEYKDPNGYQIISKIRYFMLKPNWL